MKKIQTELDNTDRLVGHEELCRLTNVSKSKIKRMEDSGHFPKRMKLGLRRVAWSLKEIEKSIESKKENRS